MTSAGPVEEGLAPCGTTVLYRDRSPSDDPDVGVGLVWREETGDVSEVPSSRTVTLGETTDTRSGSGNSRPTGGTSGTCRSGRRTRHRYSET